MQTGSIGCISPPTSISRINFFLKHFTPGLVHIFWRGFLSVDYSHASASVTPNALTSVLTSKNENRAILWTASCCASASLSASRLNSRCTSISPLEMCQFLCFTITGTINHMYDISTCFLRFRNTTLPLAVHVNDICCGEEMPNFVGDNLVLCLLGFRIPWRCRGYLGSVLFSVLFGSKPTPIERPENLIKDSQPSSYLCNIVCIRQNASCPQLTSQNLQLEWYMSYDANETMDLKSETVSL